MAYLDSSNVEDLVADIKLLADGTYFPVYKMNFTGVQGVPTDAEIISSIDLGPSTGVFAVDFQISGNSYFIIIWQKRLPANVNGIGFGYYQTYNGSHIIYKYLYADSTLTTINSNDDVNKNLAALEVGSNATRSYIAGDLVVINGRLCRITSPMSIGDTFINNTNLVYADLSNINDSGSNYTRMADGTLIQWGEGFVPEGVYVQTNYTEFAKPFIDTNYRVMITPADNVIIGKPTSGNKTTTGFKVGRTPNTATNYYDWVAIGRWK